ncbi:serine/threonine protein phosphatase [Candidatus Woesearchaeota archaeon]|nr:serine/threonine protein phosphatase [Candidatus Woesearchaeota archaeon]
MPSYQVIKNAALGKIPLIRVDESLLYGFLMDLKQKFKAEKQLIKLPEKKKIIFVGDTHGDYDASKKIIEKYLDSSIVVFTGDYVDRAFEDYGDIRNVLYLFYIKLTKKNLILLRGNHEDPRVNDVFGFRTNVSQVWSQKTWALFNDVFSYMPLAAVTSKIIALHGGLPKIKSLKEIESVPKGKITGDNKILDQVLWNESLNEPKKIIQEWNRGVENAVLYGKLFFVEVMADINKQTLIRGHDYTSKGLSFNGRCITLFTSSTYADYPKESVNCEEPIKGRIIAVKAPGKDIKIEKLRSQRKS